MNAEASNNPGRFRPGRLQPGPGRSRTRRDPAAPAGKLPWWHDAGGPVPCLDNTGQPGTVQLVHNRNDQRCHPCVQASECHARCRDRCFHGSGDKAFCSGGNTKEYAEYYAGNPQEYRQYMRLFNDMVSAILGCDKPVICRVNGMRIGGGQEIGMACDFSVAHDLARFRAGRPQTWLGANWRRHRFPAVDDRLRTGDGVGRSLRTLVRA